MITIRRATKKDVSEIKALLHETWIDTYSQVYSHEAIERITKEWHHPDLLTKQVSNPSSVFLLAYDGDQFVGMCNSGDSTSEIINIQRLHVRPGYQRKGIGSLLVGEVKALTAAKKIQLEVEEQNHRALAFYQKHGFRKVGEKSFEVAGIRIPCTVMELEL